MTKHQKTKFLEGKRCVICNTKEKLSVDHIVPVSWLNPFGFADLYNVRDNLQAMCENCNKMKGARLDHRTPHTLKFMREVIRRWSEFNNAVEPRRKYTFKHLPVKSDTTIYVFEPVNNSLSTPY